MQQHLGRPADLVAGEGARFGGGGGHGRHPVRRSSQRHDGVRHARLHHPGRDRRRGGRGARHLRVAHDRAGPGEPVRRRHRRPPVDPRGRRARGGRPVRRHHRPRLPHPVADPGPRRDGLLPRHPRRQAQLRRQQGPLPEPGPRRLADPLDGLRRRGHRPARRQAADAQARHRDRGPGQARLRRRVGRAAAPLRRQPAYGGRHHRARPSARPQARIGRTRSRVAATAAAAPSSSDKGTDSTTLACSASDTTAAGPRATSSNPRPSSRRHRVQRARGLERVDGPRGSRARRRRSCSGGHEVGQGRRRCGPGRGERGGLRAPRPRDAHPQRARPHPGTVRRVVDRVDRARPGRPRGRQDARDRLRPPHRAARWCSATR